MIPNWLYTSTSDSPDHPGSILYHSESSEVSYYTNQELVRNFFCCFLHQTGSSKQAENTNVVHGNEIEGSFGNFEKDVEEIPK